MNFRFRLLNCCDPLLLQSSKYVFVHADFYAFFLNPVNSILNIQLFEYHFEYQLSFQILPHFQGTLKVLASFTNLFPVNQSFYEFLEESYYFLLI